MKKLISFVVLTCRELVKLKLSIVALICRELVKLKLSIVALTCRELVKVKLSIVALTCGELVKVKLSFVALICRELVKLSNNLLCRDLSTAVVKGEQERALTARLPATDLVVEGVDHLAVANELGKYYTCM
jgi:hypothetical protein